MQSMLLLGNIDTKKNKEELGWSMTASQYGDNIEERYRDNKLTKEMELARGFEPPTG